MLHLPMSAKNVSAKIHLPTFALSNETFTDGSEVEQGTRISEELPSTRISVFSSVKNVFPPIFHHHVFAVEEYVYKVLTGSYILELDCKNTWNIDMK
jgi:hypothetical protein